MDGCFKTSFSRKSGGVEAHKEVRDERLCGGSVNGDELTNFGLALSGGRDGERLGDCAGG
jgi:hypothetical protein